MSAKDEYFRHLCAQLEPMAMEPIRYGNFTYVVGDQIKMSPWAFRCNVNGALLDIREARSGWKYLRNVTVTSTIPADGWPGFLTIVDPSLGIYDDPEDIYYERMQRLKELPLHSVGSMSFTNNVSESGRALLAGPYGSIFTWYSSLDYAWMGSHNVGANEINDSDTIRVAHAPGNIPFRRGSFGDAVSALPQPGKAYGLHYKILPSDWSLVPDSQSYDFRYDCMDASLDLSKWTRVQSASGNIDIEPDFAWVKIKGNETWGGNGLYTQQAFSRIKSLIVDINIPASLGALSNVSTAVGWMDGAGVNLANFAHGMYFVGSGPSTPIIGRFETVNGTFVNTTFLNSAWMFGKTYRCRITPQIGGGAIYEIQGHNFQPVGSTTWTTLSTGTPSLGTTDNLHAGAIRKASAGYAYIGDFRVSAQ